MILLPNGTCGALILYAPICDINTAKPLFPIARYKEIQACRSEKTKCEKYLVWKLLEHAVKDYLNLDFANLKFTKLDNGQWVCPDFYFSLSHTDGAICVAVSHHPIGVDIEKTRSVKEGLYSRVLTDKEYAVLKTLADEEREDFFLKAWVKKESIFKRNGGTSLMPSKTETDSSDAEAHTVYVNGERYFIGIAVNKNEGYEIIYTEEI